MGPFDDPGQKSERLDHQRDTAAQSSTGGSALKSTAAKPAQALLILQKYT